MREFTSRTTPLAGVTAAALSNIRSMDVSLPTIIAHRGNAAEFPENTLEALQSAVDLGVRHVELDVQLSSDRIPLLLHDADFRRMSGRSDSVFDLVWSRVRRDKAREPAAVRPGRGSGPSHGVPAGGTGSLRAHII
jgi:glycerophosphoryl diester phosphodiesterase